MNDTDKLIKRIISILKRTDENLPEFILKKRLKGITGYYDVESIALGVYLDIIPTLIHELIHMIYPEASETTVIRLEGRVKRKITINQLKIIIKEFAKHL